MIKSSRSIFIGGCVLAGACGPLAVAQDDAAAPAEAAFVRILPVDEPFETVRVETAAGTLVGEASGDVNVFRGVPYAAAPVGGLRWKPPQPVEPWAGLRAALAFEPPCPQPVAANESVPNQGGVAGVQSEDCLYLEVYAPAEAENAPVVVWMHGGGFFLGAGHLGSYVGTSNAEKGVITVSINYRLGALGSFAHPAITAEEGAAGSYATMDGVAALEWVRDNIAAFGGNPENVTIAGQSAGGVMVVNLLAAPSAKGLFDKAVVQSGAYMSPGMSIETAETKAVAALGAIGVDADADADALRSVSAQTLSYAPGLRRGFGPVIVDGEFFSESPKDVFEAGAEADVPLLVGANNGESGFHAARKLAALAGDEGAGAWLYRFDYVPAFREAEWPGGAIHSAELMYTFDSIETSGWSMGKTDEVDDAVADLVSSCWVAFYKMAPDADEIECADGFTWPAYDEAGDAVAQFTGAVTVGKASQLPDGPPPAD